MYFQFSLPLYTAKTLLLHLPADEGDTQKMGAREVRDRVRETGRDAGEREKEERESAD